MPVIPDPGAPPTTSVGLVWSEPSAIAQVTVPIQCGIYWVVVPSRPDLNLEVIVLSPITSMMPGGIQGQASHTVTQDLPQSVHEILGSEFPIITQALEAKSEKQSLYGVFIGDDRWESFLEVWNLAANGKVDAVLLQSDTTRQWWVNLGASRKVDTIQREDPSFQTLHIVSLDTREVAAA